MQPYPATQAVPDIQVPEGINDVIIDETLQFVQTMSDAFTKEKELHIETIALVTKYKKNLSEQFNALPWFVKFKEAI